MRKLALSILLSVALLGVAFAEEEAPTKELKRGFEDGTFVDDYFGITYVVDGLKKGFGFGAGGDRVLFAGKLPGNADVEVLCNEAAEEMTSAQWRDKAKAQMAKDGKTRSEMATGDDPAPWITFVQESFAGFERPHGYAFFARGRQCFVVHVQVREKDDASAGIVQKALAGLTVAPSSDSMLVVHIASKRMQRPLDDPRVMVQAANAYMQEPNPIVPLAMKALKAAQAREDELEDGDRYMLYRTLGFAQLKAKAYEPAVGTWTKVAEIAAKADNPSAESNAHYNLACALSLLERLDEGFEALKAALEKAPEAQGAELKKHAQEDPDLANLRADPRWAEVAGGDEGGDEGGGEAE